MKTTLYAAGALVLLSVVCLVFAAERQNRAKAAKEVCCREPEDL